MPIRLIGTIILLILVTIFAGANVDHKCDITFIFYTFHEVPVFMTVFVSFAIGAILMIPFTLGRKKREAQKPLQTTQTTESQNKSKEESKTLFDFKIKRESKPEKSENEKTKNEKDSKKNKKSVFGFGKKKPDEAKIESASTASVSSTDSAESTGAPV